MGLISAIKSVLGIGDAGDRSRDGGSGTDVTVERETDATSERAVKESDAEATGADVPGEPNAGDAAEPDTDETEVDDAAGADTDDGTELTFENEPEAAGEGEPEPRTEGADDDSGGGEPVDEIKGIGPSYSERLADAGVHTVSNLADADAAKLNEATGIGENRLQGWIDQAKAR